MKIRLVKVKKGQMKLHEAIKNAKKATEEA